MRRLISRGQKQGRRSVLRTLRGPEFGSLLLFLLVISAISIREAQPVSPGGRLVGETLVRSGNYEIEIKTGSLEILSLLKLVKRLGENRSAIGGRVNADSQAMHGFSFDPEMIYVYNEYVPQLNSRQIVFEEPGLSDPLTIPQIKGNLALYRGKVCYIRLEEVLRITELVILRSDPRWQVVGKTTATGSATSPSLTTDASGGLWMAYISDREVYVTTSIDSKEWSPPIQVTQPTREHPSKTAPSLIIDRDGILRLAYQVGESIAVSSSSDGAHWSEGRALVNGHGPFLHQDSTGIFRLVLSDGEPSICLLTSEDFETWSEVLRPTRTDGTLYRGWNPRLLEDRSGTYRIAYATALEEPSLAIYLAFSSDGKSWSDPVQALETGTDEFSFAQDSERTYWIAFHSGVPTPDFPSPLDDGNSNIFALSSSDSVMWDLSDAIRVTDDPAADIEPSMIQDRHGNYWIAFSSWRSGGYDVYLATWQRTFPGTTTTSATVSTASTSPTETTVVVSPTSPWVIIVLVAATVTPIMLLAIRFVARRRSIRATSTRTFW